uniref:Infection structure-specific protein 56 n=1 Tax=Uromyces appendiculatus TaxID=5264 RepID=INF56_UROAP|nr:RecName: Full=Infection structure-specific protein 56 [Uromyces appendiculatus]AAA34218.1 INF56 [Uromyces appendiculatus]
MHCFIIFSVINLALLQLALGASLPTSHATYPQSQPHATKRSFGPAVPSSVNGFGPFGSTYISANQRQSQQSDSNYSYNSGFGPYGGTSISASQHQRQDSQSNYEYYNNGGGLYSKDAKKELKDPSTSA